MPRRIHILLKCFRRRSLARYPIPQLLRRRRVPVPRPTARPATKSKGETRRGLPPPYGSQRKGCRDDAHARLRAPGRLRGADHQGDRKSRPATAKPAWLCRRFLAPKRLARLGSRSASVTFQRALADATLPLRVLPATVPRSARPRKPAASACTKPKGSPQTRTTKLP